MAVNKQNMILWVKGLRSNRFKQATNALAIRRNPDGEWGHCCLGVACEIAIENGLPMKVEVIGDVEGSQAKTFGKYDDQSVLPVEVATWLGVSDRNPMLKTQGEAFHAYSAAGLNDTHGYTYEQIAQCIIDTYGLEEELCQ